VETTVSAENKIIQIVPDRNSLIDAALTTWKETAAEAIEEKGYFTVALSGGSTPIPLYQKCATLKKELPWKDTYIFQVDERYVGIDHDDNNYKSIYENMVKPLGIIPAHVVRVPVENNTAENAARGYEDAIKEFFCARNIQFPRFDLMFLGIGGDGHTASLFPGLTSLSERKRWVVSVKNDTVNHERITLTFPVLNQAKHIVFLMSGKDKAYQVVKVLKNTACDLPAALIRLQDGIVTYLVDKEAAWYM